MFSIVAPPFSQTSVIQKNTGFVIPDWIRPRISSGSWLTGCQMFRSTILRQPLSLASVATRRSVLSTVSGASSLRTQRFLGTIPQPPGYIQGTVNDPVKLPPPSPSHGSYHWSFERLVAVGMAPLVIAPLATGSLTPVLDATLGSLLLVHVHLGLESCIIDYIPKRVYGKLHNLAIYALYGGTALSLYGLYEYETNDIGLTATIGKVWNA
ncbi:protein SHH4 [Sugiyamaella lignohabitans]|uniref:Succinate dehydrogenase [ubiquinone] cytochrome b small subunit n=1 Tax=Sugiyamaella lignohabitans TaxID=796027 RepID=A0A167DMG4_9ASCO|nr:protein SHH4 [Sugiyamaella lignohabitans]ANB13071.1 protein SHH4 [Sugiyamaella lignohabitans]